MMCNFYFLVLVVVSRVEDHEGAQNGGNQPTDLVLLVFLVLSGGPYKKGNSTTIRQKYKFRSELKTSLQAMTD